MGSIFAVSNSYNVERVMKAEYYAANVTQEAGNEREAAITALQEFSRTLGNQQALEAAGKEYNAATEQLAEVMDGRTVGRANITMRAAEVQGALAAQAGALGIGGSSVRLLEDTTRIQSKMEAEMYDEETKHVAYHGAQQNAGIMGKAINSLDNSQYFASLDHTIHLPPQHLKNRVGAIIGSIAAFWLGGASASEAAAGTTMASWKASNGDFAGAEQLYGQAARNAMQGFQNYQNARAAGKNSWFEAAFGSNEKSNDGSDAGADGQSASWFKSNADGGYGSGSSWGWDWGDSGNNTGSSPFSTTGG